MQVRIADRARSARTGVLRSHRTEGVRASFHSVARGTRFGAVGVPVVGVGGAAGGTEQVDRTFSDCYGGIQGVAVNVSPRPPAACGLDVREP